MTWARLRAFAYGIASGLTLMSGGLAVVSLWSPGAINGAVGVGIVAGLAWVIAWIITRPSPYDRPN